MKTYQGIAFSILFFLINFPVRVNAQDDFESFKDSINKEFNAFEKQAKSEFDEFVKQNDKEFAEFLRKSWKEFELFSGTEPDITPKPVDLPAYNPSIDKKDAIEASVAPMDINPSQDKSRQTPVIPLKTPLPFETLSYKINFYGTPVIYELDTKISGIKIDQVNEQEIGNFWEYISKTNYSHLLNQLLDYKIKLNLNDWGYYLLVNKIAQQIFPASDNTAKLITWYMLSKSRYKVKIAHKNNKAYIIIPSLIEIYETPYFTNNNIHYYVMDLENLDNIHTYKGHYLEADKILDLNINNPINLKNNIKEKIIDFSDNGEKYSLPIKYNINLMEFYKDYPLCDISVYFNAAVSHVTKETLIENFTSLIINRSEQEAVSILLNFVQTSFQYKTDKEHLGREKFYFPEELFYYPYSDCEDRAVLFSWLVKELLNLEVIGLNYPGHISTGVNFSEDVPGDYFMYKGKKYIICDPTYINAPMGTLMPEFKGIKARAIEIENRQIKEDQKSKIWELVFNSGGYHGDNGQDIVFDQSGNSYVTGYFSGEADFGKFKLTSHNNSNDIFFAKYDKQENIIWAKKAGGKGNDMPYSITYDNSGYGYITGSFDRTFDFDNNEIKSNGGIEVFVLKFDKNGNFVWLNKADIESTYKKDRYNYFISKFDPVGNWQWTRWYDEMELANNYEINIDASGNCYITGSISTTMELNITELTLKSYNEFDVVDFLIRENEKLINNNYDKTVAGLFAVINLIKRGGGLISGKFAQKAVDKAGPEFRESNPKIYKNIGKVHFMKNKDGIISIMTTDNKPVYFGKLKISNNAKVKIISYKSGNVKIDVLSGIEVGKAIIWYNLNFIKLYKEKGNLLFDYDKDHTQTPVSMRPDILD